MGSGGIKSMNLKKRDKGIIAIVVIILLLLIIVIVTTNTNQNNNETDRENNNGNFNNGNAMTSAAEITNYRVFTNWQQYENYHTSSFYEDGIYHEIPTDDSIRNQMYSIYGNISNAGNTVLKQVEYEAVFYDDSGVILFSESGWLYDLNVLETRPFNVWASKSSLENYSIWLIA